MDLSEQNVVKKKSYYEYKNIQQCIFFKEKKIKKELHFKTPNLKMKKKINVLLEQYFPL